MKFNSVICLLSYMFTLASDESSWVVSAGSYTFLNTSGIEYYSCINLNVLSQSYCIELNINISGDDEKLSVSQADEKGVTGVM